MMLWVYRFKVGWYDRLSLHQIFYGVHKRFYQDDAGKFQQVTTASVNLSPFLRFECDLV
jgi:hypothetical protein